MVFLERLTQSSAPAHSASTQPYHWEYGHIFCYNMCWDSQDNSLQNGVEVCIVVQHNVSTISVIVSHETHPTDAWRATRNQDRCSSHPPLSAQMLCKTSQMGNSSNPWNEFWFCVNIAVIPQGISGLIIWRHRQQLGFDLILKLFVNIHKKMINDPMYGTWLRF